MGERKNWDQPPSQVSVSPDHKERKVDPEDLVKALGAEIMTPPETGDGVRQPSTTLTLEEAAKIFEGQLGDICAVNPDALEVEFPDCEEAPLTLEQFAEAMNVTLGAIGDINERVEAVGDILDELREVAVGPEQAPVPFLRGEDILFGLFQDDGEKITSVSNLPHVFQISLGCADHVTDVFHERPVRITLVCDYVGWINILGMRGNSPMALVHKDNDTCLVFSNPTEVTPTLEVATEAGYASVQITFGSWKVAKVALNED